MSVFIDPALAREIADVLRQEHGAVAAALFGPTAVTEDDWQRAIDRGHVDPEAPRPAFDDVFRFGAWLASMDAAQRHQAEGITLDEFRRQLHRDPLPQTRGEAQAARVAAAKAAQYVVGLGDRVGARVAAGMVEEDAATGRSIRQAIRDATAARFGDEAAHRRMRERGIDLDLGEDFFDGALRATTSRIVSDIGHATGEWTRDLRRIAQTEGVAALNEGLQEAWREDEQAWPELGPPRVFKLPRPDACPSCVRLHLDDGIPRIFDLTDLEAAGTNVGRKQGEWRAVVGPVHPWCGCNLLRVPRMLALPEGWTSGEAAPTVIGPGGRLAGVE